MRLIVKDTSGNDTEGILTKKDIAFLALKVDGDIKLYHWSHIKEITRIYKGDKVEVNIESLRKGR